MKEKEIIRIPFSCTIFIWQNFTKKYLTYTTMYRFVHEHFFTIQKKNEISISINNCKKTSERNMDS